jgi:large subunit ribosomal protein L13
MKCFQAKADQLDPQWYIIDATDAVVGRLAAQIAPILMGKHRPTYTPHIDTGDFVIVTNVDKVVFTGNKWQQKEYERYTGYPGGHRTEVAWKLFQRHPERILEEAVRRMLPKSKLGRHMLGKLRLVVGSQHEHQSQQPIPLDALSGRPSPSGAIYAPERTVGAPGSRRKRAKARAAAGATATATAPAPAAEAPAPAPEPAPEA